MAPNQHSLEVFFQFNIAMTEERRKNHPGKENRYFRRKLTKRMEKMRSILTEKKKEFRKKTNAKAMVQYVVHRLKYLDKSITLMEQHLQSADFFDKDSKTQKYELTVEKSIYEEILNKLKEKVGSHKIVAPIIRSYKPKNITPVGLASSVTGPPRSPRSNRSSKSPGRSNKFTKNKTQSTNQKRKLSPLKKKLMPATKKNQRSPKKFQKKSKSPYTETVFDVFMIHPQLPQRPTRNKRRSPAKKTNSGSKKKTVKSKFLSQSSGWTKKMAKASPKNSGWTKRMPKSTPKGKATKKKNKKNQPKAIGSPSFTHSLSRTNKTMSTETLRMNNRVATQLKSDIQKSIQSSTDMFFNFFDKKKHGELNSRRITEYMNICIDADFDGRDFLRCIRGIKRKHKEKINKAEFIQFYDNYLKLRAQQQKNQ